MVEIIKGREKVGGFDVAGRERKDGARERNIEYRTRFVRLVFGEPKAMLKT
jgi:hypothetical protein